MTKKKKLTQLARLESALFDAKTERAKHRLELANVHSAWKKEKESKKIKKRKKKEKKKKKKENVRFFQIKDISCWSWEYKEQTTSVFINLVENVFGSRHGEVTLIGWKEVQLCGKMQCSGQRKEE